MSPPLLVWMVDERITGVAWKIERSDNLRSRIQG
jgi:hypothetical protein